jgi:hypothetical protein
MIPIQIRDRDLNSYLIDQIVRERDVGTHGLLSFIDGQQVFSREVQVIENATLRYAVTRRQLLGSAGMGALALSKPAWAQTMIDLPLPGGPGARAITTAFPQKGPMILQRTRPPLLETPFEVFDKAVFTP